MRSPVLMASCLASLLGSAWPAPAQPRLVTQPVSLGPPSEDAKKASIGVVGVAPPECRPVFTTSSRPVGPPMAEPEKQTEGWVVVGQACDARR